MNKEALKREILEEDKEFSIEDFYNSKKEKALIFISPEETLNTYVPYGMTHTSVMNEIYYLTYNDKGLTSYLYLWYKLIPKRCDIVISLTDIGVIEVVLPNKANLYEIEEFNRVKSELEATGKDFSYVFINGKKLKEDKNLNEASKILMERLDVNLETKSKSLKEKSKML